MNEAQTVLPVVEALLRKAQAAQRRTSDLEQETQQIQQRIFLLGGVQIDIVAAARRRAERDKTTQEVQDTLAEIDAIGVQVKDLDIGLLDFPCAVDDEVVLLCWKYGEEKIEFWHGMEEGFKGRKPIDERILRGKKREKPN